MGKISNAEFSGSSGTYSFEVYPIDTTFNPIGAVYIFTRRSVNSDGKGVHEFVYIGQTDSLGNRIPRHEKWPDIRRNQANCICVHVDRDESSRLRKETDLRGCYATPCNDQ